MTLDQAISKLRPGAEWSLRGNTYAGLVWLDAKQAKPTADEVAALLADPKAALIAFAATRRWQTEVGGVTVNGIPVPTDDRAKLLILGAAQTLGDADSAPFIASGVNYGTLTGAQFKAINASVVAHVQATFAALGKVLDAIASGAITTTAQIDSADWPPNK